MDTVHSFSNLIPLMSTNPRLLSDIYNLYNFDSKLREIFLKKYTSIGNKY